MRNGHAEVHVFGPRAEVRAGCALGYFRRAMRVFGSCACAFDFQFVPRALVVAPQRSAAPVSSWIDLGPSWCGLGDKRACEERGGDEVDLFWPLIEVCAMPSLSCNRGVVGIYSFRARAGDA